MVRDVSRHDECDDAPRAWDVDPAVRHRMERIASLQLKISMPPDDAPGRAAEIVIPSSDSEADEHDDESTDTEEDDAARSSSHSGEGSATEPEDTPRTEAFGSATEPEDTPAPKPSTAPTPGRGRRGVSQDPRPNHAHSSSRRGVRGGPRFQTTKRLRPQRGGCRVPSRRRRPSMRRGVRQGVPQDPRESPRASPPARVSHEPLRGVSQPRSPRGGALGRARARALVEERFARDPRRARRRPRCASVRRAPGSRSWDWEIRDWRRSPSRAVSRWTPRTSSVSAG